MLRKIASILMLLLICNFGYTNSISFGLDEPVGKIVVKLIPPNRPQTRLSESRVSTEPLGVNGVIPIEIGKTVIKEDIQDQRYVVEYFIDGDLVHKIDGSDITDSENINFSWPLDTTKYRNGKHKLVANFWDKEGDSFIGIVYIVIDNPMSVERIKEVTANE